ncbi:MAG: hypothetical protein WD512_03825, partial [Candidatus Paceibacterota bacterium]
VTGATGIKDVIVELEVVVSEVVGKAFLTLIMVALEELLVNTLLFLRAVILKNKKLFHFIHMNKIQ